MGDAMKSSTMAENHKNMKYCNTLFEILVADMVDVSIEGSENKCMRDDSPLSNIRQRKGKQVKKTSKGKFKASVSRRITLQRKWLILHIERGNHTRGNFFCYPTSLDIGTCSKGE